MSEEINVTPDAARKALALLKQIAGPRKPKKFFGEGRARRMTVEKLDGHHGCDRNKRLVVSLDQKDMITIHIFKSKLKRQISAFDLYTYILKCEANRKVLEKARDRKAKKAVLRERRALDRMERKLRS